MWPLEVETLHQSWGAQSNSVHVMLSAESQKGVNSIICNTYHVLHEGEAIALLFPTRLYINASTIHGIADLYS